MSGTITAQHLAEFLPILLGSTVLPVMNLQIATNVDREPWVAAPAYAYASLIRSKSAAPTIRFDAPLGMAYDAIGMTRTDFTTMKIGLATFLDLNAARAVQSVALQANCHATPTITSIKASGPDMQAMATVEIHLTAENGNTCPLGDPASDSFATFALGTVALHGLGPVVITNGAGDTGALWGVSDVQIANALTLTNMRNDGAFVPHGVAATSHRIAATVTNDDALASLANIPWFGTGNATTSNTIYFRKYDIDSGTFLDTDAVAITLTGRVTRDSTSGNVNAPARTTFLIEAAADDPTVAPFSVATNASVPTTSALY